MQQENEMDFNLIRPRRTVSLWQQGATDAREGKPARYWNWQAVRDIPGLTGTQSYFSCEKIMQGYHNGHKWACKQMRAEAQDGGTAR